MLTDIAIRQAIRDAKAAGKPLTRFDERGLTSGGSVLWRFKYVFRGLEKKARERRDDARKRVADG